MKRFLGQKGIVKRNLRTDPSPYHRFCVDAAYCFCGFDEVPVGKVGVAGGGPVPPVSEQLADQGVVEEPDFGARRVQYQAVVVRKSVRSVWA